MEEVATPKIDVVALLHLPIRRNATPILRFPILNRRKKRPCLASSSRLEEDCTLGRRLLGFAAAAIVAVSSSMCCNSPALAQSLTIAFPVSRALEVTTVQRTLVEAWGLIRETFFDPTFNHQDWDSKLQQTLMQMFPLRSADAAYAKIKAMLSTLGDPFTRIISPKEYQSFRVGSDGNLQGVGLFINSEPRTGRLVVMSCIKSSPADRAGIHKGEELVEINGEKLDGIDSEAAALKLRGRVGTFVTVKLKNVSTMEMKKMACGVLFAAASMTAVMAAEEVGAPAPGPSSAASATLPALGSLVGASLLSLFSYYLH